MKWSSFLLICALAFLSNACEQHPASELEGGHGGSAAEHPETDGAHPAGEKKAEDAKPGEAPKFFPEKK